MRDSVLHPIQFDPIISKALEEDWGYGDWTTDICVPDEKLANAKLICREPIVVSGVEVIKSVFKKVDESLEVKLLSKNGDYRPENSVLLEVSGNAKSILKGERVALNLFGRMCGIATATKSFVDLLEGSGVQLLDTRKTTPGLRILEKSATMTGGARNHRFGLCDGVIVKENHIRAAGGIKAAVERLLESLPPTLKVEVEVTNLDELKEAMDAGADIVMLDNMSCEQMSAAVKQVEGRLLLEASGNVRLSNIKDVAATGVNFISTSAIVHSARWSDLSLLFDE